MKKQKKLRSLIALVLALALLGACGGQGAGTSSAEARETGTASPAQEEKPRIVVVSNRSFGDKGPIDSQAVGLEKAAALGFETKTLESLTPDVFEEDIRSMAEAGYDIIVTSFPPVTEAAVAVAKDFPDTDFVGIYQYVNAEGRALDNFWSVEYKSQEMMYALGTFHAKLTKSKKIGIITGQETASSNSGINGFMDGVVATDPECSVEFAIANTYDDPAIGKEIAMAMISRGVDTICLTAGKTSTGAIDACAEAGIYCTGDNGDFFDRAPNNLPTHLLTDFGVVVEQAAKDYLDGSFKGGEHSLMTLMNKGSVVVWDTIDRFVKENPDKKDEVLAAMEYAQGIEEKIISGEIEVTFKPDTPQAVRPE